VLAENETANLNNLKRSVELSQLLTLETGENLEGSPYYAYSMMHKGRLEDAYQRAGGNSIDPALLVLLAASAGAESDWQERALELNPDEVPYANTLLYLAALAYRSEKPYGQYIKKLEELNTSDRPSPLKYVKKFLEEGRASETLEQDITDLDPMNRGLVLATAIVMFPAKPNPVGENRPMPYCSAWNARHSDPNCSQNGVRLRFMIKNPMAMRSGTAARHPRAFAPGLPC
jgi:hypothetical protein